MLNKLTDRTSDTPQATSQRANIDLSLITYNLSKSPTQRAIAHEGALKAVHEFRRAGERLRGHSKTSDASRSE